MISICIPVHNFSVHSLVQELSNQLTSFQIKGEIIVYDDFSEPAYRQQNLSVSLIPHVTYKYLPKNVGRIAIRNLLASAAKYDWLLFIDGDSQIVSSLYLFNYIQRLKNKDRIYAGGTTYQQEKPICEKALHWKYGRVREIKQNKHKGFHTNNFFIDKSVFVSLNFPPQLTGYGHEDTWMHIELVQLKKQICFIDNPVLHLGIETTSAFLDKTYAALNNLFILSTFLNKRLLRKYIPLYSLFFWQQKLGINLIIYPILKWKKKKIMQNLYSCKPNLVLFDIYRVYCLIVISKYAKHNKQFSSSQKRLANSH